MRWDLARLWHEIAVQQPQRAALLRGGRQLSWEQFDTAATGYAATLRQAGLRRGDVLALCLPNTAEYLVLLAATMRCGATVCGINYRYRPHEIAELLNRIQPAAVCYRPDSGIEQIRDAMPTVRLWYPVDGDQSNGALDAIIASGGDRGRLDSHPDDVMLKCTGGTTGSPLAVRWRIGDLLEQLNSHNPWRRHDLAADTVQPDSGHRVRLLVASPLMHGSGLTRALGALCAGGTVITMPGTSFDPYHLLDALADQQVTSLAIVGDAHAVPLADALDAESGRWPLPHLETITSSGAAWTHDIKNRLLMRLPHLRLLESLGATEATGLGFAIATAGAVPPTGEFRLGRYARVFTSSGQPAQPGQTGTIGVRKPHPAGIHPCGALPAARFAVHDGDRYLLSGDHVQLIDGQRFLLLGRPDDCINTGGEKVYAPEVTAVIRQHPHVRDAIVLGTAHPELGHTVTALVELRPAGTTTEIGPYARQRLAGFKVPTAVIAVPAIPRTAAGKPDLAAARHLAQQHLGSLP
ncbi:AMP-binding protein [Actinoplanes sp. NPDC026619]|uniref:AMP-binding protein n=1 Tax=Actinoplanes sp. NPDC026619 TaxID=3155798 RepID=UPI0033D3C725